MDIYGTVQRSKLGSMPETVALNLKVERFVDVASCYRQNVSGSLHRIENGDNHRLVTQSCAFDTLAGCYDVVEKFSYSRWIQGSGTATILSRQNDGRGVQKVIVNIMPGVTELVDSSGHQGLWNETIPVPNFPTMLANLLYHISCARSGPCHSVNDTSIRNASMHFCRFGQKRLGCEQVLTRPSLSINR